MTDLDRFKAFYEGCGVKLVENTRDGGEIYFKLYEGTYAEESEDTTDPRFDGHPEFYTVIVFNSNGKFIGQGFWE